MRPLVNDVNDRHFEFRLKSNRRTAVTAVWCLFALSQFGCGGSSSVGNNGGGSSGGGGSQADFSISLSPSTIPLVQGTTQTINVQITPLNGFSGTVQVTTSGLEAGVTANSPSISVTTGEATGSLQLTASNTANAATFNVTVGAFSGSLHHIAPLSVETYSSANIFPFTTLGGGVLRGYYDSSRQLLFASNFYLNEVDVLSTVDLSVKQRISVPRPVGLDQMPDGDTIVVGTMTQGIGLINENNFTVQMNYVPDVYPGQAFTVVPIIPAAMANGKVLFIGSTLGLYPEYYLGGGIYEWNPASGAFGLAPIASATGVDETEHLARSGDHKFAIFDQYGGGVFVYSSDTDSFASTNNGYYAGDVAANSDGSQFAELINGEALFYDSSLNLLSSVPLTSPYLDPYFGLQYSTDGSLLYAQTSNMISLSPVAVIDAKQFTQTGMIPTYFGNPANPAYLLAADDSNAVYVTAEGGVGRVDCSHPVTSPVVYQLLPLTGEPDSAPLNMAAAATFVGYNIPVSTAVTVGGVPGSVTSNTYGAVVVNVPSSSVPGPADVVFTMPDGTIFVFPQDFSYGVTASALSSNLAADQAEATVTLSGFGLAPQNQPPSISFAGVPAAAVSIAGYGVTQNSLEAIQVTAPATSSSSVSATVMNGNGSSTLSPALTYLHTTIVPAAPGLSSLLYDSHRNLLYATRTSGSQIYVFDPANMQWTTPLQPPGAIAGSTYTHIVLTSDGTQMIALDSTNALVSIFSPDNPAAGQSIVLRNPNVPNGPPANYNPQPWPDSVAITSTGKAWIDMSDWYPAEIDLSTMALQFRTDSGMGNGNNLFRMSADSTQFAVANVGNSGGTVFVWDPATDTFLMQGLQDYLSDLAISNSGQTIAAIAIDQLAPDDATYFLDPELHYINAPAYPDLGLPDSRASFGIQFSRQGSVYVLPRLDSIDFIDTAKGTLRARFLTPEPIITPQNVADIKSGALAMDTLGQTIFVISASGITVIQFPSPIDDLPQAVWPFSSPRRGTVATATQQRRLNLLKSHALTFSRPGSHRIQALKTEK